MKLPSSYIYKVYMNFTVWLGSHSQGSLYVCKYSKAWNTSYPKHCEYQTACRAGRDPIMVSNLPASSNTSLQMKVHSRRNGSKGPEYSCGPWGDRLETPLPKHYCCGLAFTPAALWLTLRLALCRMCSLASPTSVVENMASVYLLRNWRLPEDRSA